MKNKMFILLFIGLSCSASLRQTGLGKTHFIVGRPILPEPREEKLATVAIKQKSRTSGEPQILFSPDDEIRKHLIKLIDKERQAIRVAVYMLTDFSIATALCEAKKRGILVEVITDVGCLKDRSSRVSQLCENGCSVFIYNPTSSSKGSSLMHHKFILFANNERGSRIWTGSFNFTKAANAINQENVVIFSDAQAFNKFLEQFKRLKDRSYRYFKGGLVYT